MLIRHWLERLQVAQAARHSEPAEWQEALGGSQTVVHASVEEVQEMVADIRAVLGRYDDRLMDVAARPEGSRPVEVLVFAQPYAPRPAAEVEGETPPPPLA
ncbi:hypothetical protein [Asanoa ferruginea]|uniref:hypothetical protein n=1 Tax=Asanoa ferruginea TaxID=53367 RepID=UPI000E27626B|nr:hypothetical protein [Asanoa ferruginea]